MNKDVVKEMSEKGKEKEQSFLDKNNNSVKLKGGKIIFGKFKNKDKKEAYLNALERSEKYNKLSKEKRELLIENDTQEWIVAFMIQRGMGFLKGKNVNETYENLLELDFEDAYKLGHAAGEFLNKVQGDIKKKSKN
ncbi:MAG: hypothetical protein ACOC1K_06600 [Nanoarchaeota archaeon]